MPLSHSPHLLPAAEISEKPSSQDDRKDFFCTEFPIRTQVSSPIATSQPHDETVAMATASRAIAPSEKFHIQQAPMSLDATTMQWSVQGRYPHNNFAQESSLFVPNSAYAGYAQQVQNGLAYNTNTSLAYPIQYSPRAYNGLSFSGLPSDMATSYPPATFFHSPPQLHDTLSLPDHDVPDLVQLNDDFDMQYDKQDDQHDYMGSYPDMSRASTPYSNMHEDNNPIDKEQPYAQLIYRALLDAPNHTMILRDIYDWFRRYTDKAAQSETKGWQNSIRHNLSMNGVSTHVQFFCDVHVSQLSLHRLTIPAGFRESRFSLRLHQQGFHVAPYCQCSA